MAIYGKEFTICYVAWDSALGSGKTGDVANHTLRWVKDGTASAPTNSPSEVDATNTPGIYKLTLTATETSTPFGVLAGKSSTASVVISPVAISFERVPDAAPGASGGLPTLDASNRVKADMEAIDALATNGNNATLKLKQLNIINSAGDAIYAQASGGNGCGIFTAGNGSGHGVWHVGGATGDGQRNQGGSGSGNGTNSFALNSGDGIKATGGSIGGAGQRNTGTAGVSGFINVASSGNVAGQRNIGVGTGAGMENTGGSTGPGTKTDGGATSGIGFDANGTGGQPDIEGSITGNVTGSVAEATSLGAGAITGGTIDNSALNEIRNKFLIINDTLNGPTTTPTTVTLSSSYVANDDACNGFMLLHCDNSLSLIQMRTIVDYDHATLTITVDRPWTVNPVDTDRILVYQNARGLARVNPVKGVALGSFEFTMYDSTNHAPVSGLTVTAERSIDGGAYGACSNGVSGVSDGTYKIDLSASDMNGNIIKLKFTATGADQQDMTIVTQE